MFIFCLVSLNSSFASFCFVFGSILTHLRAVSVNQDFPDLFGYPSWAFQIISPLHSCLKEKQQPLTRAERSVGKARSCPGPLSIILRSSSMHRAATSPSAHPIAMQESLHCPPHSSLARVVTHHCLCSPCVPVPCPDRLCLSCPTTNTGWISQESCGKSLVMAVQQTGDFTVHSITQNSAIWLQSPCVGGRIQTEGSFKEGEWKFLTFKAEIADLREKGDLKKKKKKKGEEPQGCRR